MKLWGPIRTRTEEEKKYLERLYKRIALVLRNIELLDYAIKNNMVLTHKY